MLYHFGCKSTGRVKKNKGRHTFLMKWGISAKQFMQGYLHIGEAFMPRLPEVETTPWQHFVNRIKLINTIISGK